MSYQILADGEIEFICQGKGCGKTIKSRQLRAVPKGWFVSGILRMSAKDEADPVIWNISQEIVNRLGPVIGGHWCSRKCAKSILFLPDIIQAVKEAGLCVVLYGKTELVIDGTKRPGPEDAEEGEHPQPRRGGSRDDDDLPKGSLPPYKMEDGENPI